MQPAALISPLGGPQAPLLPGHPALLGGRLGLPGVLSPYDPVLNRPSEPAVGLYNQPLIPNPWGGAANPGAGIPSLQGWLPPPAAPPPAPLQQQPQQHALPLPLVQSPLIGGSQQPVPAAWGAPAPSAWGSGVSPLQQVSPAPLQQPPPSPAPAPAAPAPAPVPAPAPAPASAWGSIQQDQATAYSTSDAARGVGSMSLSDSRDPVPAAKTTMAGPLQQLFVAAQRAGVQQEQQSPSGAPSRDPPPLPPTSSYDNVSDPRRASGPPPGDAAEAPPQVKAAPWAAVTSKGEITTYI